MTSLIFICFLENKSINGIYNAGFENLRIIDIAKMISEKTGAKIKIEKSQDPRSYRVNSDKLLSLGFTPKKAVANAISEIIQAVESKKT